MRLPLRHLPPTSEPARQACAHLEALAHAAHGLPLRGAARLLTAGRSRGRYGNALQWHFGLEPHDGDARLDWEDRIEIKIVSIWARQDGRVACDKLKVCDLGIDPWHKLANVLWVFVDRIARVVVGHRFFCLRGRVLERLAASWHLDPHFERPDLFVEARQSGDEMAPAYYLSAAWFRREGLLDGQTPAYGFDARWWSRLRQRHGGREPALTIAWDDLDQAVCGVCAGTVRGLADTPGFGGARPAIHELPLAGTCATTGHFLIDGHRLPRCQLASEPECLAAVVGHTARRDLWRLADRVPEPDDHGH